MYQVWPIIKLIQYILSRKVQLNSWQALIKPWDGFCLPLEVRTHPLPPPDSGGSFSSFGIFVFEFWVLRASVFVFECFVFETTLRMIGSESGFELGFDHWGTIYPLG